MREFCAKLHLLPVKAAAFPGFALNPLKTMSYMVDFAFASYTPKRCRREAFAD
jgi:hypothetical protein